MDRAEGFGEWVFATIAGIVLMFGSFYWGKLVPEKLSWILGGIVWGVVLVLALTGRLL